MKYSYQRNYSNTHREVFDSVDRRQKARKILAILSDYCQTQGLKLRDLRMLELGCSAGAMSTTFAKAIANITAVDIDKKALTYAKKYCRMKNITYRYGDAMNLPFPDKSFSLIIANNIYEHVPNAKMLMEQIYRVLKQGGICYFAGPNKYTMMESDYHVPFLSWLPKDLASLVLRRLGKADSYYETPLSVNTLRSLVHKFRLTDYTITALKYPARYAMSYPQKSILAKIPSFVYKFLYPMLPSFFWVLQKDYNSRKIV